MTLLLASLIPTQMIAQQTLDPSTATNDNLSDSINLDSGQVLVRVHFIVRKNGKIKKVWVNEGETRCGECKSDDFEAIEKEAIRVVKNMDRWEPDKGGKDIMFTLPLRFIFNETGSPDN